ncbi:MAG: RDD family protein [Dehalococcoidia bacterium]|nr:RDD family protein [Dehalococcoidia bacterium]
MQCPRCGTANPDNAQFCQKCSASLKVTGQQPQAPGAAQPAAVTYAGFWRRFAAVIIDGIILNVVGWLISLIFLPFLLPGMLSADLANLAFLAMFPAYIVLVAIDWLYYALLESSKYQATLGKMALGIIVTDLDGKRVSFERATGRYFAKIISAIILLIGFLMIAFTQKKQGLHDMIADTLVIKKD